MVEQRPPTTVSERLLELAQELEDENRRLYSEIAQLKSEHAAALSHIQSENDNLRRELKTCRTDLADARLNLRNLQRSYEAVKNGTMELQGQPDLANKKARVRQESDQEYVMSDPSVRGISPVDRLGAHRIFRRTGKGYLYPLRRPESLSSLSSLESERSQTPKRPVKSRLVPYVRVPPRSSANPRKNTPDEPTPAKRRKYGDKTKDAQAKQPRLTGKGSPTKG